FSRDWSSDVCSSDLLPSARSGTPRAIAWRFTAISGSEVPNATSTRPVTNGDTPPRRASPEAPLTSESPPSASSTSPSTNKPSAASISRSPWVPGPILGPGAGSGTTFDVVDVRRQAAPPLADHVVGVGFEYKHGLAAGGVGDAQVLAAVDIFVQATVFERAVQALQLRLVHAGAAATGRSHALVVDRVADEI